MSWFIILIVFKIINRFLNLQIRKQIKSIIFPITKGYVFSLISGFAFILILYEICENTKFSLIQTTFNDVETGEVLLQKERGRSGFILIISGIFVLNNAINQVFKVTTSE